MRNLLRFIVQHHFLILFLLIETFSLFLLFSANPYQKVRFYNASHTISGRFPLRYENIRDYFSLHYENRKLAEENATLVQPAWIIIFLQLCRFGMHGDSLHAHGNICI